MILLIPLGYATTGSNGEVSTLAVYSQGQQGTEKG